MKAVGWLPERFDSAIRESGQPKPSGGSTVIAHLLRADGSLEGCLKS
jgi:hypothetical protein